MEIAITEFLKLAGALGLFIYGMLVMSEGIQKLAGRRMRDMISYLPANRFNGILTGFTTTAIFQSSSASTVMIAGFVNVGLLKLRHAISMIMGANIGTTLTAWLLVIIGFNAHSGQFMYPILAIAIPLIFFTSPPVKNAGQFLIGFALIFIGLDMLQQVMEVMNLNNRDFFRQYFVELAGTGYPSIFLFILIGAILTITVQSSSAAIALTLGATVIGLPFELVAAIVLGENLGTTITANLAALVGNVHAKRAARAHFMFNAIGVIWMLLIFRFFLNGIDWLLSQTSLGTPLGPDADPASVRYGLAIFHTAFNLLNTVALIWFVKKIEKSVVEMTPARSDDDEQFRLEFIGSSITATNAFSILNAKKEIGNFAKICGKMNKRFRDLLNETDKKKIKRIASKIYNSEEITDRIYKEIAVYLSRISEKEMTEDSSSRIRALLSMANDMEKAGDIYFQMTRTVVKKHKNKIWFNQNQRENLNRMLDKVDEALKDLMVNIDAKIENISIDNAIAIEDELNSLRNSIRKEHLRNTETGEYQLESGMVYSNLFNSIERVGDLIFASSEANAGRNIF